MGQRDPTPPPPAGALDGGFRFSLSDGEHTSSGHFFRVMAQKQLFLSLEGSRTLTVCPGGSATHGMPGRPGDTPGSLPRQPPQTSPWLWSTANSPLVPLTGSVQPLSSQSLRASSSAGTDPQHLLYRLVQGPRLGRLFHAQHGSTRETLANFTQAEVRAQFSTATTQTQFSPRGPDLPVHLGTTLTSWTAGTLWPHHAPG